VAILIQDSSNNHIFTLSQNNSPAT